MPDILIDLPRHPCVFFLGRRHTEVDTARDGWDFEPDAELVP
jgi:hypothetical protein